MFVRGFSDCRHADRVQWLLIDDEPAFTSEQCMRVCDLALGHELHVKRRFADRERVGCASRMRPVLMDGVDDERSVVGFANFRIWERQRDGNRVVRIDDSANDSASARTGTVSFLRPECSGADCGLTVALNQSGRPSFTLRVTLIQGEQISGPYQGIVTGPNDFSCSLSGAPVSCPPATFPAGSTVPLAVALVHDCCGDRPIFTANTKGCDSFAGPSTCIVNMTGNRDVTIGIGCAICLPLGEVGDLVVGRWRAQNGRLTPLEFRVADHPF
jgi:hypothetical protein